MHILVAKALVEDADSVCFRQPDMSDRPSNLITELIRRGASLDVMGCRDLLPITQLTDSAMWGSWGKDIRGPRSVYVKQMAQFLLRTTWEQGVIESVRQDEAAGSCEVRAGCTIQYRVIY